MSIASKMEESMEKSSWIRKMFEEGSKLKAEFGNENVFDFSLGNPNLEPPQEFKNALKRIISENKKGVHGYMPNTGYPHVRKAIVKTVLKEQGTEVSEDDIVLTCGASGGLNVIFKSLLNPDEEVIVSKPFFVEYRFYADNHGGNLKTVKTKTDFSLDIDAIEKAVTEKTKIVLVNSPNNPTGRIYSEESLKRLGRLLEKKSKEYGSLIYLVSDEPYRNIVFDDAYVPSIFSVYNNSIVVTSHSKDISLPGERIGYICINPAAVHRKKIADAMALANRILGFVNAPAIMQRVLPHIQGSRVDIGEYKRKRDILCKGLSEIGYEFDIPKGAFYLFPKSPMEDDTEFVKELQKELILAVPGTGFGGPGYFRLCFCVEDGTITKSMAGFENVFKRCRP